MVNWRASGMMVTPSGSQAARSQGEGQLLTGGFLGGLVRRLDQRLEFLLLLVVGDVHPVIIVQSLPQVFHLRFGGAGIFGLRDLLRVGLNLGVVLVPVGYFFQGMVLLDVLVLV